MGRRSENIVLVQRHRIGNALIIVGICVIVGLGYPALDKEFDDVLAFVNGGLIGFIGGIGMAAHQDYSLYSRIRRQNFLRRLLLITVLYTLGFAVLIFLVTGITGALETGESFIAHISGSAFQDFIFIGDYLIILLYALILSSILSFVFSMRRKVDGKILWNMISGKYAKPRDEERIFMFMDLNDSTKIAEMLGEIQYFKFINEFFLDITPAILKTGGHIYRYVGDEIVVTWPITNKGKLERSIQTYFLARGELRSRKEKYLTHFNTVPSFKAVFHCGSVTVGEIGDVKSQLVFHGDMMYIMGLIEKQCHKMKKSLLVSSTLLEKLTLPKIYSIEYCGKLKNDPGVDIDLNTIVERTAFELS